MISSIFPVTAHTDHVGQGSTFIVIRGKHEDGMNYVHVALEKGATTVVLEHDHLLSEKAAQALAHAGAQIQRVENARQALAQLSAQALGYPSRKLKIIGITGTKGKTTITFLLEHLLRSAGHATALVSTVKNSIKGVDIATDFSTPLPDYLQMFLRECVDQGVEYVVMEVAAQALTLHRVDGIAFDGVIFSNFAQEHLEFYGSMDEYLAAKCLLFDIAKPTAPILVNGDDKAGQKILAGHSSYLSFGVQHSPSSKAYDGMLTRDDSLVDWLSFSVNWRGTIFNAEAHHLMGDFNAYNCIAALGMCLELGIKPAQLTHALAVFPGVPGRLNKYMLPNGATCFIDYAHNPMSFNTVLRQLRLLSGDLIVVFGAGGDRDPSRRPQMGAIAAEYADHVVVTSDNPRTENPEAIMDAVCAGIPATAHHKVIRVADRIAAIKKAYAISQPHSVIALLGKGHEDYQVIGRTKIPLNEQEIIKSL